MDYFQAIASPSLGTTLTAVDFTDISGFSGGVNITVDGGGDININAAGVYLFQWYSGSYSLTSGVTSSSRGTVNVTGGGGGNWAGNFGLGDEAGWEIPIRINDADDTIDFSPSFSPDASAIAAWATTATFPVVIQLKMLKLENNAGVADSIDVRVAVVRLGAGFE